MAKVLVIPDVHLKPEIFDKAEKYLMDGKADYAVQLGDLVDDWGQHKNVGLYRETLERALKFAQDFPETIWCIGNHDFAYIQLYRDSSGYSTFAEVDARELLDQLYNKHRIHIAHHDGNCIFSHAGLMEEFIVHGLRKASVKEVFDFIEDLPPERFWTNNSPLWARGNYNPTLHAYAVNKDMWQVVGHTPMKYPELIYDERTFYTDTWSTCRNGDHIGNRSLVVVDTAQSLDEAFGIDEMRQHMQLKKK